MKTIRLVISVFLAVCLVIGWVAAFGESAGNMSGYNKAVKYAHEMIDKQLYQKSVGAFETALGYKENKALRIEMLDTYKMGVDDGVYSMARYISACETACEIYPNEVTFWEIIIDYYCSTKSYNKAYEWYNKAIKSSVKSEKLSQLGDIVTYSYTVKPTTYEKALRTANGYYTVKKADLWGVLNPAGETYVQCIYTYISPVSSQLNAMYNTSRGNRLYDASSIVQYKLTEEINETLAYGCGFLPVKISDNVWRFYDCENDCFVFDEYEAVSSFQNNYALVKIDGIWSVINTNGEKYGSVAFSDVKLYDNGEYIYDDVMIALDGNAYRMYDGEFEPMNDFSAADMDNYYGGYIAYQSDNGLWGYVDIKGKTVIEPQYTEAKSFSAGLAAIATEVYEEVEIESDSEAESESVSEEITENAETTEVPTSETLTTDAAETQVTSQTEESTTAESVSETEQESVQTTESAIDVQAENNTDAVNTESVKTVKWGFINTSGKQVIDSRYFYAGYFTASGYALVADMINSYYFIALRFV